MNFKTILRSCIAIQLLIGLNPSVSFGALDCFLTANGALINGRSAENNIQFDIVIEEKTVKEMDENRVRYLAGQFFSDTVYPVFKTVVPLTRAHIKGERLTSDPQKIKIAINKDGYTFNGFISAPLDADPQTLRSKMIHSLYYPRLKYEQAQFQNKVNLDFGTKPAEPRPNNEYKKELEGLLYLMSYFGVGDESILIGKGDTASRLKVAFEVAREGITARREDGQWVIGDDPYWKGIKQVVREIKDKAKAEGSNPLEQLIGVFISPMQKLADENKMRNTLSSLPADHPLKVANAVAASVERKFDTNFSSTIASNAVEAFRRWLEVLAQSKVNDREGPETYQINDQTVDQMKQTVKYPATFLVLANSRKVVDQAWLVKAESVFFQVLEDLPQQLNAHIAQTFPQPSSEIRSGWGDTNVFSADLLRRRMADYQKQVDEFFKDSKDFSSEADRILSEKLANALRL